MKKLLWISPAVIILAAFIFMVYVKLFLPDVGEAPDLKIELTPERMENGKYLANHVMVCVDCHSTRDYTKYSAPVTGAILAGGGNEFTREAGLPGNFYPANLTPYYLKNWTDGEIFRAITMGVTKKGKALFPVMPYHLYGQASDEDIMSVIAWLRTVPEVPGDVKPSEADFPVSFFLNMMPQKRMAHEKPDSSDKIVYGKYLATIGGCIECHTPMKKGQPVWEEAFTGNREFFLPSGIVRSSNITPHKTTGTGAWTEDIFLARFKVFSDTANIMTVGPGDFNTPMPWTMYAGMKDEDLKAIYAFLQSLPAVEKEIIKFIPKKILPDGKK
jgi:hypothetical protein